MAPSEVAFLLASCSLPFDPWESLRKTSTKVLLSLRLGEVLEPFSASLTSELCGCSSSIELVFLTPTYKVGGLTLLCGEETTHVSSWGSVVFLGNGTPMPSLSPIWEGGEEWGFPDEDGTEDWRIFSVRLDGFSFRVCTHVSIPSCTRLAEVAMWVALRLGLVVYLRNLFHPLSPPPIISYIYPNRYQIGFSHQEQSSKLFSLQWPLFQSSQAH